MVSSNRRLSPFLVISVAIHIGFCFLYVRAVRGARIPVPHPRVYRVSLVELPPEPEVKKPEPEPVKEKKPERIPEQPRPKKKVPEKKKEEPKEEKKETKPEPEPEPEPKQVVSGPLTVEAEDFPFAYYLALIESRIGGRWSPPSGLVSSGKPPAATVRFEIGRSGKVRDPHITISSGIPFFDRSAIGAVRASDPFPPLPDAFPGDRLGVNFVFRYED